MEHLHEIQQIIKDEISEYKKKLKEVQYEEEYAG